MQRLFFALLALILVPLLARLAVTRIGPRLSDALTPRPLLVVAQARAAMSDRTFLLCLLLREI